MLLVLLLVAFSLPLPSQSHEFTNIIERECAKYGFATQLIDAQIFVESSYNPLEVSSCGARGLMQILPSTAEWLGVDADDLWYPEINIALGVYYDDWLYKRWPQLTGNMRLAFMLACYHDGIGNVRCNHRYLPAKFTHYGNLYYFRILHREQYTTKGTKNAINEHKKAPMSRSPGRIFSQRNILEIPEVVSHFLF